MKTPVALHWSSGKDAALAFHRLRQDARYEVVQLLTTVSESHNRVVMHGVRQALLEAQAATMSLPLRIVPLPPAPDHRAYEAAISAAYLKLRAAGITTIAFGDIFLEDLRAYREASLKQLKMSAIFPLWKNDTRGLIEEMQAARIRAVMICSDASKLDKRFLGREIDANLVAGLPSSVDACGERGEFHTFVWDAPFFATPIRFLTGEIVHRSYGGGAAADGEGFYFLDLLPKQMEEE